MGIRFYCPNGHKLNVKEFQAGQRGLCPVCGIKMQIPMQSTRPSSRDEEQHPHGGAVEVPPGLPGASGVGIARPIAAPPQPPQIASPSASRDPLLEGGSAVWYVRTPSGGQYGPATADIMRTWLAEGRVVADALVWREGWPTWQEACIVFPQLSRGQVAPVLENLVTQSIQSPRASRGVRDNQLLQNPQLFLFAGLVVLVVLLIILFIVVLMKQ